MASAWNNGVIASAAMIAVQVLVGCGGSSNSGSHATVGCVAGQMIACACPDGRNSSMTCSALTGAYDPCLCPTIGAPGVAGAAGGSTAQVGTAGVNAIGSGGAPVPTAGIGGGSGRGGASGLAGVGGRAAGGSGASGRSAGGAGGAVGAAGSIGAGGAGSNDLDTVRQVCVDTINMYRATIPGLAPLARGSAAQEMCSDTGAKKDGDSMVAHGSSGDCKSLGLPGEQDTCPGWAVGGFSGNATLADALKKCLMQMWGEGMPPVSRQACQMDYQNCFLKYGHYLNMSDPNPKVVACGFYQMMNGSWWMNQNFGN